MVPDRQRCSQCLSLLPLCHPISIRVKGSRLGGKISFIIDLYSYVALDGLSCPPVLTFPHFLPSSLDLTPSVHFHYQILKLPPPPISPPHLTSLSHLLHYKQQKKSLYLSALQGMDQVLPFFPFSRRHFKVDSTYLSTFSFFSVFLFSLQVLQSFCQESSVTTYLYFVRFLLSFFVNVMCFC